MKVPPDIVPRPALAHWIWMRDLTLAEAGEYFGCSHEHIRAICRPFGDPRRRVPSEKLMARIVERTGRQIGPPDFYPPNVQSRAAFAEVRT